MGGAMNERVMALLRQSGPLMFWEIYERLGVTLGQLDELATAMVTLAVAQQVRHDSQGWHLTKEGARYA
jgi:hypothetical protein